MLDTTEIIMDLSTTIIAVGIGAIVFKKLDSFYRLLFWQVAVYLLLDPLAIFVAHCHLYNAWVYDLQILVEMVLLLSAAQVYFNSTQSKPVLLILFCCFLILFGVDVFYLTGNVKLAYHAAVWEDIVLSCICISILYFQLRKVNTYSSVAMVMASIGMIIYFACSIPYICIMYYLDQKDHPLAQELFQDIVVVLADLRYFLIAIAFFLASRNKTAQLTNLNHG